jgi:hypothetical protein
MSRRLKITLPESICAQLDDMAASAGEPVARVAAQIVRNRVAFGWAVEGPPAPAPNVRPKTLRSRPSWLKPSENDRTWRDSMWTAIVALYKRYPSVLEDLGDQWWENESRVETLCALVTWRHRIDEAGRDPQEELVFQTYLVKCGEMFHQDIPGGWRPWKPDGSPERWRVGDAPSFAPPGSSGDGTYETTSTRMPRSQQVHLGHA